MCYCWYSFDSRVVCYCWYSFDSRVVCYCWYSFDSRVVCYCWYSFDSRVVCYCWYSFDSRVVCYCWYSFDSQVVCYSWYSFDSQVVCKGHMNREEWCNPVWLTCRNLYWFTSQRLNICNCRTSAHCSVLCAVYELKGSGFFCFSIFGHGDLHPSLPSSFPVRDKNKLGKWNHCINSPSPCLTSQHMQNKNYHNSMLSQIPVYDPQTP